MKKILKISFIPLGIILLLLSSFTIYGLAALPDEASISGDKLTIGKFFSAEYDYESAIINVSATDNEVNSCESKLKLFDTIPIKTIKLNQTERRYVLPGGELVGIRLNTDGAVVVGTEAFFSNGIYTDPARDAGILSGDIIVSANGTIITNNDSFSEIVNKCEGKTINIELIRDNKKIQTVLKPEISDISKKYKCGLWIRDCASGVGTVTYRDISTGAIATLGHGIYDSDTKKILPSFSGELFNAELSGIKKGKSGEAGEIHGIIGNTKYGKLKINCPYGIYGEMRSFENTQELIPVAFSSEVKTGKAQIICSVQNGEKKYYDIEIEHIDMSDRNSGKNMTVKITDAELIDLTGGIVQGMSGSPIIQNGMLVGAVTHVFLNDPQKGYAIFAENMLEISDTLTEKAAA